MSQAWTSNSVYKALTNLQAVLEIGFLLLVLQLSMLMLLQTWLWKQSSSENVLMIVVSPCWVHWWITSCALHWTLLKSLLCRLALPKVTHMKSCTQIKWTCNCRNPRSKHRMENINFCVVYLGNINLGINKPCLLFAHVSWNAFGI